MASKAEQERKLEYHNPMTWKLQLTTKELKTLPPLIRSKHLAYAQPPAHSQKLINRILIRLRNEKIRENIQEQKTIMKEHEKEKLNIVIGRLKAAEARQRIHVVMLNFNNKVDKKLNQLVYVQPTGVMSVRTEYLVRSRPLEYLPWGKMNPVKDDKCFYLTLSERARLRTVMNEKIV